ncbi:MAG: YicC family protein [Oscillospiraceae bacterium]|nr:YicC family protein [Oscillospiraceae bacterium]
MTGYGNARISKDGVTVSAELRSVNNRYFDCGVKIPRNFIFAEDSVRSRVKEHISRGKIDVFISIEFEDLASNEITVNDALLKEYINALDHISEILGKESDLDPVSASRLPDVLVSKRRETDEDFILSLILEALGEALLKYDSMRCAEGAKLKDDILGRLSVISGYIGVVENNSVGTVNEYQKRLKEKITAILENREYDENRILQEVAIFADRVAVDEETVRLKSHISQMTSMLEDKKPVGKKLDFLIQEFNREANTIGSKCLNSDTAHVVVDIKCEIEKIREQIQNIE